MSEGNATITIEIEGQKRGFMFGMLFWDELQERLNLSIAEVLKMLTPENPRMLRAYRDLFYSAAFCYNTCKKIPIDFEPVDANFWIDSMTREQVESVVKMIEKSKILGNEIGLLAKMAETIAATQPESKKKEKK